MRVLRMFGKSGLWLGFSIILLALALMSVSRVRPAVAAKGQAQEAAQTPQAQFPANAGTLGAIPDSPAGGNQCGDYSGAPRDVTFNVAGINGPVTNVAVNMTLTHTNVGDLTVTLIAPGGLTSKVIFGRPLSSTPTGCGDDSNLEGTYDFSDAAQATPTFWDAAAAANGTAAVVAPGSYRATTPGGAPGGGSATFITQVFTGIPGANGVWTLRIHDGGEGGTGTVSAAVLTVTGTSQPPRKRLDFDGDGKADFAVFRPSNSVWYILQSSSNTLFAVQWGFDDDVRVQGFYDSDNKTDIAVFRRSEGKWYLRPSVGGFFLPVAFGNNLDIPVPADYTGDGFDDLAVFRPSIGTWFTSTDPANNYGAVQWGIEGDLAAPADYDGDGRADITVFRPSSGVWYIRQSSNGTLRGVQWGAGGDKPAPGDYDGDGRAEIAVFRPSTGAWYILQSSSGTMRSLFWGTNGDTIVQADYDGDNKTDVAVWRPQTATYYILDSSTGQPLASRPDAIAGGGMWGIFGDHALAYVPEH